MKPSALSRLLDTVTRPSHDKRPSIETFPDFDLNRIAAELKLDSLGKERGDKDEPATGSTAMDDVEARIIERIEAERKASHAIVEDQVTTYAQRLSSLDFEERFSSLRQAAPACISEFKALVAKGMNDLHGNRNDFLDARREFEAFKARNRLDRVARVQSPAWHFLKWMVLASLLLIETALNGSYLAKGNEQGLLGGVLEAFGFAFLNIVVAFLLGRGSTELVHRNLFRKFLGLVAGVGYIVAAVALNLSIAHYREITGSLVEGAGNLVVQRMHTNPLGLEDFHSWVLFGIGLTFSVIAFIDSISMSDPYPGYAGVQKRLTDRREEYSEEASHLIDQLGETRDEYQEDLKELNRDLSVRRGEHDNILAERSRLLQLFDQHQTHLERSANALLSVYRDCNARARKNKPPKRFASTFKLDRVTVFGNSAAEWEPAELRKRIIETQDLLTSEVTSIHAEFDKAVRQYRSLDDLVPEQGVAHGTQQA